MGLYIKNIDMPKKAITIVVHPNGYAACYDLKDTFLAETTVIEVPAHGRTIDADAFCDKIIEIIEGQKYDDLYAQNLSVGNILREVVNELKGKGLDEYKNAPTIIPAEKE